VSEPLGPGRDLYLMRVVVGVVLAFVLIVAVSVAVFEGGRGGLHPCPPVPTGALDC